MEHGTYNPEPSWLQSAYPRAYAAAEPGTARNHVQGSNGSPVSTSFVDQQLGDSNNLSRSAFAENSRVNIVNDGHYNGYDSVATPGNCTHANAWAPSPLNNHAFGPFRNTFSAGFTAEAADHDGTALPIARNPYAWGAAVPTAHADNNTSAPLVDSNFLPLTDHDFAANASYNGVITYPTAPSPYTLGAGAHAVSMDHFMGADFHYPGPGLPIMDAFAADTNGNCYHGQFPTALSFTTQSAATLNPPTASHATHNIDTAHFDLAQQAQQPPPPQRPTCLTCNRSFGRQADLHRHAKKHRADAKVFRCACCAYSNYRKDKLDEHVKRSGHRAAAAAGMSLGGV